MKRRTVITAGQFLWLLVTAAAPVAAETELALPAPAEDSTSRSYYGHWGIGADLATVAVALATKEPAVALAWPLYRPVVHALHGQWGRAAGSLALRGSLTAGLFVCGAVCDSLSDGEQVAALAGFFTAAALVSAADWTLLSWRDEPAPALVDFGSVRANPSVATVEGGMVFGLGGTF